MYIVTCKIELQPGGNPYLYICGKVKTFSGWKTDRYFQETKLDSGLLTINLSELFKDNNVTFIKGQKIDDGKFKAVYNSTTDSYELEINVWLNRPGIYCLDSAAVFQDRDYNEENCIFIIVATNIKGSIRIR